MFEITITETRTVKKLEGKNWQVVGTKESPRDVQYWQKDEGDPKTRIEEVYGYTPEIEKSGEVTMEILKQSVETLDLVKVIKAINNL